MYKNLKDYLNLLQSRGELIQIDAAVSSKLEMAEIADRAVKAGAGAILFNNNGTQFPVAMNIFGSETRMALALGYENLDDIATNIDHFLNAVKKPRPTILQKLKLLPELKKAKNWMPKHSSKKGECQQIIDREPNLDNLPILTTWPNDGGPFITLPMVHTMDAVTGERNVGMYRAQRFSPTTLGLHWHKHKTGARHFQSYKQKSDEGQGTRDFLGTRDKGQVTEDFLVTSDKGQVTAPRTPYASCEAVTGHGRRPVTCHPKGRAAKSLVTAEGQSLVTKKGEPQSRMPVAIALGGDPCYTYCATAPLPDGVDEYMLAGFLRSQPVQLVKCITCDIEVPSDCDIVIEGYVDTAAPLSVEGPFGDHTGFYSLQDLYPIMHVTCITHRKGAIYPATVVGPPPMEDKFIARATETIFLPPIRAVVAPDVIDLTMPWQGVAHNLAIVTIDKRYDGQGFKVASALWGAGQMSFCKFIVVGDNKNQQFSLNGIKAEVLITRGIADVLDHAGEDVGLGGKMCFDTTSAKAIEYRFEILYDDEVRDMDEDKKLWIALANVDPLRDVKIEGNIITFDARSKKLSHRDFPNIVTMSDDIIAMVDSRWSEYGIGDFIPSPSIQYKNLVTDGAVKINASPSHD